MPRRERPGAAARWRALLLVGLWLAAAIVARAGEPRLTLALNATSVPVGSQSVLTITLEGFSQRAGKPQLPEVEGLEFYESGRSTNMSWVNGSFTSSVVYSFIVRARREGNYTIGPARVEDKGSVYASETVPLQVAGTTPPPAPRPGGGGGRETAPADARGLFARVLVEPREAFLDQQVTLRFRLYQRADVTLLDVGGFEPPASEGFWREDLGPQRDFTTTIDGQSYQVREIAWALFPTRAGDLEIGPGQVVCQVPASRGRSRDPFSGFFGRFDAQNVPLTTEPVRVRVLSLPEAGRPPGFSGSVGDYGVSAGIDPPEVRQGEPFTLTLTVSGTGHIQTIGQPAWPAWNGVRVYDSGEAVSVSVREDRLAGEKSFKQVLVPERAGPLDLPAVRFAYFDPQSRRYVESASDPITLRVLPAGAAGGEEDGVRTLGEDILYIHTGIASGLGRASAGTLGARHLVHLLPLLLLGLGWMGSATRRAAQRDPVRRSRSAALRRAQTRLEGLPEAATAAQTGAGLSELLERYLGDWLGLRVRGMLRGELSARLGDAGIGEDLVARVLGCFEWCDEVRYGGATGAEAQGRRAAARELLADLERAFRAGGASRGRARGGAR